MLGYMLLLALAAEFVLRAKAQGKDLSSFELAPRVLVAGLAGLSLTVHSKLRPLQDTTGDASISTGRFIVFTPAAKRGLHSVQESEMRPGERLEHTASERASPTPAAKTCAPS